MVNDKRWFGNLVGFKKSVSSYTPKQQIISVGSFDCSVNTSYQVFPISVVRKESVPSVSATSRTPRMSFIDYLLGQGDFKLAAYEAVMLFKKCAPVFDGIDRITQAVSTIPLKVFQELPDSRMKTINNHPLELLLKRPYFGVTSRKFLQRLLSFLIITGDAFVAANSIDADSIPVALHVLPTQAVTMLVDDDGFVKTYQVTLANKTINYMRNKTTDGDKYFARLDTGAMSELYHMKTFNPFSYDFEIKGMSPLNPVYHEVEQYAASSVHNLSLLKRGTTMDGIFLIDKPLSDDELQRLKAQVEEYHSGEANVGRPFIMDNAASTRYEQKGSKAKDMDYEKMKKDIRISIYSILKIPLPKVTSETMTMANLDASQESFYDDAVLPWAGMLHSELTMFLMRRYTQDPNFMLSYDSSKISALRKRTVENLLRLEKANCLKPNELRNVIGYEPVIGGDQIYIPANTVPLGGEEFNPNQEDNNTSQEDSPQE
jgi:HK97 family phage portal protein